jgi:hypothetical protein
MPALRSAPCAARAETIRKRSTDRHRAIAGTIDMIAVLTAAADGGAAGIWQINDLALKRLRREPLGLGPDGKVSSLNSAKGRNS